MTSWRDRFQEGSFRGAAFLIDESDATFGRRNQIHEYPLRDLPFAEDLGRAARLWNVECFVVGDDYDHDRDALIKAIETAGPGTLIHPYLGTLNAVCQPSTVRESTSAGGIARFSLQFVEAGQNTQPVTVVDTQTAAQLSVTALQTQLTGSLSAALQIPNQASFVGAAAQGILGQAQAAISAALAAVQPAADLLSNVQRTLQGLVTSGLSLLSAPEALAGQIFSAIDGIADLAPFADDALDQLTGLISFGSGFPEVATTTPSRVVQADNQAALVQLVRCAAAAAAVNVVSETDFTSYDEAVAVRDPLADQLDELAEDVADTGDDALAAAIDQTRLAMIQDVTARGASLARLYAYTPATTEPAVVIAQRLYGDATRADEIVARNVIQHPGFVPGGLALEVLSDA